MTPQERKDLENLLDMFAHPGWKLFTQDINKLIDVALETPDFDCPTNDLWQIRRGNLNTLRYVSSYEEVTRSVLDEEDV